MCNGDRLQRIETWKFNVKGLKLINLICACADSHLSFRQPCCVKDMARGKIYTNRKRTIAVGEEKAKKGKYF